MNDSERASWLQSMLYEIETQSSYLDRRIIIPMPVAVWRELAQIYAERLAERLALEFRGRA